jgi:hypothetical protein
MPTEAGFTNEDLSSEPITEARTYTASKGAGSTEPESCGLRRVLPSPPASLAVSSMRVSAGKHDRYLGSLQQALRRGLLMGYVEREEALPLLRGRIRHADQARTRFGLPLPLEVHYDDYTVDTEANRILKTACGGSRRCATAGPRSAEGSKSR